MQGNRYLGMLITVCLTPGGMILQACDTDEQPTQVSIIDRATAVFPYNPEALIVGVDATGKLTLNRIEIGTIADPKVLTEKLEPVFKDRRRSSLGETEILIELTGQVSFDDVSALIASIRPLRPSRIIVMTR